MSEHNSIAHREEGCKHCERERGGRYAAGQKDTINRKKRDHKYHWLLWEKRMELDSNSGILNSKS